jgi:hypothetical protein
MKKVTITREEYDELKAKAAKYERMAEGMRARNVKINARWTPEERREKARKAARARWGQARQS